MKIFVNFKNYPSGFGFAQEELLDFLESLVSLSPTPPTPPNSPNSLNTLPALNLIVPSTEISNVFQKYSFPVWGQHCDPVEQARETGWISPWSLKEAGAVGTLLNHSEHRLPFSILAQTIKLCQATGLKTLVCCETPEEGKKICALRPDYLAYEPPELIANKTSSVISSPTSLTTLTSLISWVNPIPVVVGAGIRDRRDIDEAEKLGCSGILVSSAIMEGDEEAIKNLLF